MKRQNASNLAASVHQRLLNLRDASGHDFNLLLTRYTLERLLYRISKSKHASLFVLKGALLFVAWKLDVYRPTQDMDLLGYGRSSVENIKAIFQDICRVEVEPDGLVFDSKNITVQEIRENQNYESQRVHLMANLGNAKIPLQVDIGFGDIIHPDLQILDYPSLLDDPQPRIRAYPPETVIAEKLQALTFLGMQNSRMKDYYDLWQLAQQFAFEGASLVTAIRATFNRRKTEIPEDYPVGLSNSFADDRNKQLQWQAFLRRISVEDTMSLSFVVDDLRTFLGPPMLAASQNDSWHQTWQDGGPWI